MQDENRPEAERRQFNAPRRNNRYRSTHKPLSHVENDRFSSTYKDSHGVQHVIERKSGSARRLDLLQVPGANRAEKKALLAQAKRQMKRGKKPEVATQ